MLALTVPSAPVNPMVAERASLIATNAALEVVAQSQLDTALTTLDRFEQGMAFHKVSQTIWDIDRNEKRIKELDKLLR